MLLVAGVTGTYTNVTTVQGGGGYNNRSQQKVSVIWQMCAVHVKVGQHGSVGGALITVKGHLAVS